MFRTQEQKGFLTVCGFKLCEDGEGRSYDAQAGGFGSSGQCEGARASRGEFAPHRLSWAPGEALKPAMGGDDGGAYGRERQLVGRNREPGPGTVDSYGVAEGSQISKAG